MQVNIQSLPDKTEERMCSRCLWVYLNVWAGSAAKQQQYLHHLPRTLVRHRFQPLPTVANHGVDVDITFHHVTSQFPTSTGSALALALLAGLGVAWRSRCSQISRLAVTPCSRFRSVGSHTVQQVHQAQVHQAQVAAGGSRWRCHGVDQTTPSQYIYIFRCSPDPSLTLI